MRAIIQVTLKTVSAEAGQRFLHDLFEKLKKVKTIDDYHFAIETAEEPVTEKCVLSDEKVIA